MSMQARFHSIAGALLLIVIGSLSLLGCTSVKADTQTLSAERPLFADIYCPDAAQEADRCYLVVHIGAFERSLEASIAVEVAGGIRFAPTDGQFAVTSDGRGGSTNAISIPFLETRQIAIPFVADQSETLSGGYVILVRASGAGISDERFQSHALVFALSDAGSARIMTNSQVLDASFGMFARGSGDLSYLIAIDAQDPARGKLFVKVPSRHDSFQPELIVTVRDGVTFEQTAESLVIGAGEVRQKLGVIHAAGYRIVSFPFAYVPGSLGGQRVITVGVREGDVVTRLEVAPVTLVLRSDALLDPNPITAGVIAPVNLLEQPVVEQRPESGMRGGGISEPPATPVANESYIPWDQVITGFRGNRWQAYQEHVAGQTAMDWETFRDWVVLFNPGLQQSGFVFQSDAHYVFPR